MIINRVQWVAIHLSTPQHTPTHIPSPNKTHPYPHRVQGIRGVSEGARDASVVSRNRPVNRPGEQAGPLWAEGAGHTVSLIK